MDRQLLQEIKKKQLQPVYFFYGEETFLIEETCEWMIKQLIDEEGDAWNKVILDLDEVPIQSLVQEAETPPFFGDIRVIVGKNATFLTGSKKRNEVEHQPESLLDYLKDPLPGNIVILTVPTGKIDKRKKIVKELEKKARVVVFSRLTEKEQWEWVRKREKQLGITFEESALRSLLYLLGNDLRLINQECVKLATYVGKGGQITSDIVSMLVPRTLEQDVFKLTDCVSKQKIDEALRIWYDLLYQREEPIRILSLIIRQFRLMLQTQVLARQGKSEKEIAAHLKVHPYPVKLALKQGGIYTEEQLRLFLMKALQADQDIKSGKVEKALAVERLFLQVNESR
ncbi:DNA polymerase III subunit delta [Thermoflavimicrobium daqui]|jgi:DNA polymerase-3 subunit delta|uniref:DNA polymerase III subunit delta n=1 Tax=Thermoflavimicrobium daqui TaxID=2137476 RepID=A0A364K6B5_9BACL|nr:DNA polymerase III subunit delta [Thermoflavimicrobium daqui]RAL25827.1 DNA polymerase III subunit delta [Thermoflavimicrobium daqui]